MASSQTQAPVAAPGSTATSQPRSSAKAITVTHPGRFDNRDKRSGPVSGGELPEATDEGDCMPAEWSSPTPSSGPLVELLLSTDGSTLTVTYNGRSVVYTPTVLRTSDPCA